MKKTIAAVLTAALVLSMGTSAFAAAGSQTLEGVGGNMENEVDEVTVDVMGKYVAFNSDTSMYSAKIEWDNLEFAYMPYTERVWNPETHAYEVVSEEFNSWGQPDGAGNTVKVTNHSDHPLNVAFAFQKDAALTDDITGTMSVTSKQLATAVGTTVAEAPSVTSELTLEGALSSDKTENIKLGTVTVSLSEVMA